jgi:hypothetical protein
MDTEEANKALRGAVRKMIMRPQEGLLDIFWHHAEEPQETLFYTSRYPWMHEPGGWVYKPDDFADDNDNETR